MSWAAHELESYVIQKHVKAKVSYVAILLGCLLLNYPLLQLFERPGEVLGIPLLYAYVFLVWALLIALMALVLEKRDD